MAIQKITLIKASGEIEKLDAFISACKNNGDFHPENAGDFISETMGFSQLVEQNKYDAYLKSVEQLMLLTGTKPEKETGEAKHTEEEIKSYIDAMSEDIGTLLEDRKLLTEQLEFCKAGINQFEHFIGLDTPLQEILACEFISVRFGRIPKNQYAKLSAYESNPYVLFINCSEDEEYYWGVYFAPVTKKREVDRIFAFLYFDRIEVPGAVGTPREIIEELDDNIKYIYYQLSAIDEKLLEWDKNKASCSSIYDYLLRKRELFEYRRYASVKNDQFYYICWLTNSGLSRFENEAEALGITYETATANDRKDLSPPVKLKNRKIFRPFEMFVEMYGLPSYSGFDVTAFVAITYTLLFGIMFGDLGQGAVLIAAGIFMWKFMKMRLGKILVPCGISAMFFGLLYGSFFGYEHFLDPLYRAVGLDGKPIEVMESITAILLFSIGIGVLLVLVSMLLNVYVCLKSRDYIEAFAGNNGVTGIIFYCFGVVVIYQFMSGTKLINGLVAAIVMGVCAGILFFKDMMVKKKKGESKTSVSDYIMQNFFEVFEYILSYFSNTVSYLRVGAFVLVHAGMMMVVFSLAGESENLLIIIIGNIVVICLEGLVTGIQTLRLNFYEMFSRFYDGNGRPFYTTEVNKKVTELAASGSSKGNKK